MSAGKSSADGPQVLEELDSFLGSARVLYSLDNTPQDIDARPGAIKIAQGDSTWSYIETAGKFDVNNDVTATLTKTSPKTNPRQPGATTTEIYSATAPDREAVRDPRFFIGLSGGYGLITYEAFDSDLPEQRPHRQHRISLSTIEIYYGAPPEGVDPYSQDS